MSATSNNMKFLDLPHDYPIVDSDPHLLRVIRYMRPFPDYALIAGGMVGTPLAFAAFERLSPINYRPWRLSYTPGLSARFLRINLWLGAVGGFCLAYQNTCWRLMGLKENKREYEMDMAEMKGKLSRGEPLYGKSDLSPSVQESAARNSRNSVFFIFAIPWFNLANHSFHGVDPKRYENNEPWAPLKA